MRSDLFNILRKLDKNPETNQRSLSNELGLSLGKVNYCLKELKKKGLVKIKNFKNNKDKIKYIHVLTPKGVALRMKLTFNFMKRKMEEYDELKAEVEKKK